ncbi:hypothetical protein SASPL_108390 [Salvia splendens]|uniref:Beta-carotene isomerase D27-like C-terminal domain-containing protein n=1 Tax=Salvia splendens TaxID=180675 RepID=A0A8X8YI11_SALSN|nr:hypothetical protein SASPL_108390 [Salvia splendens]
MRSGKEGYEGLVEAATMASRRFNPIQQKGVVIDTLKAALPAPLLLLVKESEVEGRKEKNVVYVPKCRFLEETNCVGMCTNLCKMPSQSFIKDSLGMPITMVPSKAIKRNHNCGS